jgi:hypothetical protein
LTQLDIEYGGAARLGKFRQSLVNSERAYSDAFFEKMAKIRIACETLRWYSPATANIWSKY